MQALARAPSTEQSINHFLLATSCLKHEKFHLALKHIDSAIMIGGHGTPQELEFLVMKARIVFAIGGRDQEAFKLMMDVKRKSASREGMNRKCRVGRCDRLFATSLYYIGLWSYLTEDDIRAVSHLKQYLEMVSLRPSLRLPVTYAKQILRAAEAAQIDPDGKKTSALINKGRFYDAIDVAESVIKHGGLEMCDHWPLSLGAKAYFAIGKHQKARLYAGRAFRSAPQCPDTILIYGVTCLWTNSKSVSDEGERILLSLLRKKVKSLAFGRCGDGIVHAQRIRLVSLYGLFLLAGIRGDYARANRFALRYVRAVKRYDASQDRKLEEIRDFRNKMKDGYPGTRALCRDRLRGLFGYGKDR